MLESPPKFLKGSIGRKRTAGTQRVADMAKPNQRQKAKSKEDSKVRVLAVALMLSTGRCMSSSAIMRRLYSQYGIEVDRKTIYSDIRAIDRFMPIMVVPGKYGGYQKHDVLGGAEDENYEAD